MAIKCFDCLKADHDEVHVLGFGEIGFVCLFVSFPSFSKQQMSAFLLQLIQGH